MEKAVWVLRFAVRLAKIQPNVGAGAAEIAMLTYPEARDMEPEEAADVYALEEPPGDVQQPGADEIA